MKREFTAGRGTLYFVALFSVAVVIKWIMVQYALPFVTHVDETTIIKDPLKILLQYKEGSFQTSTNLFNHVLVIWHGVTFIVGIISGQWLSFSDYIEHLSVDDPSVILSFRILCALLSLAGIFVWIKLFRKILPPGFSNQFLLPLIFILNPVEINANNFVKFDALSFLFYALEIYAGYFYFILKKENFRKLIYLFTILGMAVRIEHAAFLAGFAWFDFWKMHGFKLKNYFNRELVKYLSLSLILYLVLTLNFLNLFHHDSNTSYTSTKTFEEVILRFLSLELISYSYYFEILFLVLSPAFVVLIFQHFTGAGLQKIERKLYFLVIPFLILTIILSLNTNKSIFYYLASSCIILAAGISTIPGIKSKYFRQGIIYFILIYFLTFDVEEVYMASLPPPNREVREYILSHTTHEDNLAFFGICDIRVLNMPSTITEQIKALEETGGSTGMGLKNMLKKVMKDSSESRKIYLGVTDFFWMNSKYKNKWLIGRDSVRLHELSPSYIVIFEEIYQSHKTTLESYGYIQRNYVPVFNRHYNFADLRLTYKNSYYFHSATIYKKK